MVSLLLAVLVGGERHDPNPPRPTVTPPPYGAGVEAGVSYPYEVNTRCGVWSARFDGRMWDADPPITDGSRRPPPEWTRPTQYGAMRLVSENLAEFHTADGLMARFRPRPAEAPDPLGGECG